ncbi:MAG: hypothetical protein SFU85_05760 [Candidatus Methylacidiphilales bacterium]|nr:hypothetical protein [Candidatus Methylacidiphilales bacterium]
MTIHPSIDARHPAWPTVALPDRQGVVYVATSRRFLDEARTAAAHVRLHNPGLAICLVSDCAESDPDPFWDDLVPVTHPHFGFRDKILMGLCPYQHFLYLDADTRVLAGLEDVFTLLKRFDFAGHQLFEGHDCPLPGIPDAFPEFNGGVLGFQHSPRLHGFFARWIERFDAYFALNRDGYYHYSNASDQKSLRQTVWESGLSVAVLGPEYNFTPHHLDFACANVRILHGRGEAHLDQLTVRLNRQLGNRVYIPRLDAVLMDDSQPEELTRAWLMAGLQLLRHAGRALFPIALRNHLRQQHWISRLFLRNRFTESTPENDPKWKAGAPPEA